MKEVDQLLRQSLEVSNFKTLLANAEKPVPNEAQLKSANEAAVRAQIDQLKEYAKINAEGELVHANRDLLDQGAALET